MAIESIIDVLEQLEAAHVEMLELGERKKEAVVANKVDILISLINQESKLLKRIELIEQQRFLAVHQFLEGRGIKSKLNLTISELTRLVFDTAEKKRLLQAQTSLTDVLQKVKYLNESNQQLIKQSLSYIDFFIETMSFHAESEATYQNPLEKSYGIARSGLFDTRG
ncbi:MULTISPECIES: flagellar protein FlgN [unclassified Paenibacillus]|uniref:flagellar protein FlgN n=1 Tax=unclassified Paenibacillus TaxID=185978 RepID=UPI0008AB8300|nr:MULTISPECIES: flagellar protein FlgN [unclassified Paenibacillus]NEU62434.1 flagellar protein FlgN [Paenibacillus sp. ALJ109b]QLG38195.1 flagellar protein FlgN [Paenibacillus sp. E222]SEO66269.1 FlgN protein [Paenibacillus sp. OK076]